MKTVIEMAREVLLLDERDNPSDDGIAQFIGTLTDFAELVRADEREQGQKWFDAVTAQHKQAILAEREACAKVCEENWLYTANASEMAEYIRARSNT